MSDPRHDGPPSTLWHRFVGETDQVGWWILPAFLAVGLAGAVMAGALAIVYYSQQVSQLETQTREGRQEVQGAVEEVRQARDQALEELQAEVEAVRRSIAGGRPVEDVASMGLVIIEARVNTPPPDSATTSQEPASAGSADGAPDVLAQEQQTQEPDQQQTQEPEQEQTQQPDQQETQQPDQQQTQEPEPEPPPVRPRLGVGFTVAVEDGATFLATSYGLVRDADARAGVVEEVRVTTPNGDRVAGTVHSWDEERGIALVQAPAGELPIADWRPRGEELSVGDPLTVVGITPRFDPVQFDGEIGWLGRDAIVTSLPETEFLRGSPVVDVTGRVVAVHTPAYQPFGRAAGEGQAMAPVSLFCDRLLQGCETLEAEATERPSDPEAE